MTRRVAALGLAACLAAAPGCQDRPRAPALANETVYQNDAVGVAFVTPEGWTLYAKTTLPPGKLDRPIRLTAYGHAADKFHAEFELYAAEAPPGSDLLAYLATHKLGPEAWTAVGQPTAETVRGVAATRYVQAGVKADAKMRREIVAFPRGDRQFFLCVTHHVDDTQALDQARKSVESVTWK